MQEEYLYKAMGQRVVRRITQVGKTIHVVHDLDGNRLAAYEIDNVTGAQVPLQEYVWFEGPPVAVVDGQTDEVFFVRTDHMAARSLQPTTSGSRWRYGLYQMYCLPGTRPNRTEFAGG